jgi:hypothetical protein
MYSKIDFHKTSEFSLKKKFFFFYRYVWDNLSTGYIQGMCDIVAPLLVLFDEGYYQ